MFYSVAEHCVRATELVKTKAQKKRVLLHDAAEAYGIGDMVRDIKYVLPEYMELEEEINRVLAKKYKLEPDFTHLDYVCIADKAIGMAEVRDLLTGGWRDPYWEKWNVPKVMNVTHKIPRIYPWIPREARDRFLETAAFLGLK